MRILIVGGKYGERYFAVETDRELHQASVVILKDHLSNGWYGKEDRELVESAKNELKKALEFADSINSIETPSGVSESCENSIIGYQRDIANLEEAQSYRDCVNEAINMDYDSIPQDYERESANEYSRRFAWRLLQERKDYEYEQVSLIDTEEF
jgi:hypothetical protein